MAVICYQLLLIIGALCMCINASTTQTIIFKCCKQGEELEESESDGDGVDKLKCVLNTRVWVPVIYSPSKKNIVPHPPSHWKIVEGKRPNCGDGKVLTYVPYNSYSPVIILDVGDAILDGGSGDTYDSSEYCADTKALLVCIPRKVEANRAATTMRPKVHRCCGENAVFSESRDGCVNMKEPENVPPLMPNATSAIELLPGFPVCKNSENFTIIGDAKDADLQSDGGLNVDGISLPSLQYCVERIKELEGRTKIFACSEHALRRPVMQAMDIRFTMYPVSLIISAIFLAATLAAGWLLPASHHVLHWRCQTHHVVCLMLGDLLMAVIQLASNSLHGNSCKALVRVTAKIEDILQRDNFDDCCRNSYYGTYSYSYHGSFCGTCGDRHCDSVCGSFGNRHRDN
ncbi:probable G-protein coupled receptor Mth-like 1 [Diachasma alloeum]|uniref:probable G-protein coupled receptor Mth-like 1 n=1 Tax=Diachasma alloeum TaxID=454923 RepID=UPI000738498E|nr:probable G-protein coupled receptor Mth-like 1 [Diachasma alloeum]